ncbi:hypothetical protein NBRGN_112_00490 [Nocardia brasiliensis NBRC 14402]|uniref:hypothetical protein n=1 Tax=Nocardia brasiliensis TaxID=37326 RepID=UPI0002F87006|nr:hypothetical protein [Nocardia brasiliensis]ASF10077.1 hypothetical protein CEQ30_24940 [Nocardia brasiliensis]GAJ86834.1 hypothetical protein NBRGN_112_00490 [Nocardia brasiliensis NBRC 14402]SUB11503.1 Uncharacterised protein [Nocardia brasiliensis]
MGEPKDDWKGFKRPGALKLNHDVATKAATYCADMLDIIDLVLGSAGELSDQKLPTSYQLFGHLPSGQEMTREVYKAGTKFREDIIDAHKKILTDMAQSFLIAGNKYKNADGDSKAELARIQNSRHPSEGIEHAEQHYNGEIADPDHWYDNKLPAAKPKYEKAAPDGKGGYQVGKYEGLPSSVKVTDKGAMIDAEPAATLVYEDFHKLYTTLQGINYVQDLASDWHRMATQLDRGFADFKRDISNLVDSEEWTGYGANSAKKAVNIYTGTGAALVQAMKVMSANLMDAYNWGKTTQVNMPDSPKDTYSKDNQVLVLGLARDAFANWYELGMEATSTAFPPLPFPEGPKQQTQEPGPPGPPGPPGTANPGLSQKQAQDQQRRLQEQAEQQRKALEEQMARARQEQQQRAQEQQRQEQQRAAQQAQQQAAQQAMQAAQQLGQQLGQAVQQAGQQLASAAQQAAQQAALAGIPGLPSLKDLEEQAKKAMGTAGSKGAGGAGGPGGAPKGLTNQNLDKASKLFPRAEATTTGTAAAARAGLANSGMGMGPGPGPGAAGQQKEHKRADYLDSTEHLEDAIGDAPVVVKPVVEQ